MNVGGQICCAICKTTDFSGGRYVKGAAIFCMSCANKGVLSKQKKRHAFELHEDLMMKRCQERHAAREAMIEIKRNTARISDEIRQSVLAEILDGIRRLSFLERLSLLFNPFGRGSLK